MCNEQPNDGVGEKTTNGPAAEAFVRTMAAMINERERERERIKGNPRPPTVKKETNEKRN